MKLAILGTDADILSLADAAVNQGHELVRINDVRAADAAKIRAFAPGLQDRTSDWETLLDRATADAVLVGRGTDSSDTRAEQLKRLATEAVPMLTVFPVTESVLTYYELDMIRGETGGILRHYNPLATHPLSADLARWVREGHPTIGTIHQVTCERRLPDATRVSVLDFLAKDLELLLAIGGKIRRVNAIGPHADDENFASLQVQITNDTTASMRWTVGPRSQLDDELEVTLVGEHGTVALQITSGANHDAPTWKLEVVAGGQTEHQELPPYDSPVVAIEQLAVAVAELNGERQASLSTWDGATRAMEVVDAVQLSLEKGRTVEVFQQQLTERLAFRGAMAALGCGLLLIGFTVIVLVTLMGGAEGAVGRRLIPAWPVGRRPISVWPMALLAALAFFLLLQTVPLLVTKSKQRRKP